MLHPWVLLSCTQLSDALAPLTANIEQIKNPARQRFVDLSPWMASSNSRLIFLWARIIGRASLLGSRIEEAALDEALLLE